MGLAEHRRLTLRYGRERARVPAAAGTPATEAPARNSSHRRPAGRRPGAPVAGSARPQAPGAPPGPGRDALRDRGRAGISPQYLSEIERGRKEPSSEMIAALAGALDTTLVTLTEQVAGDLRRQQAQNRASGPVHRPHRPSGASADLAA